MDKPIFLDKPKGPFYLNSKPKQIAQWLATQIQDNPVWAGVNTENDQLICEIRLNDVLIREDSRLGWIIVEVRMESIFKFLQFYITPISDKRSKLLFGCNYHPPLCKEAYLSDWVNRIAQDYPEIRDKMIAEAQQFIDEIDRELDQLQAEGSQPSAPPQLESTTVASQSKPRNPGRPGLSSKQKQERIKFVDEVEDYKKQKDCTYKVACNMIGRKLFSEEKPCSTFRDWRKHKDQWIKEIKAETDE